MDEELEQLAMLAIRNAFWNDFSALVNKYLEAAAGLNVESAEEDLAEVTSIYGRKQNAKTDFFVSICTVDGVVKTNHKTIVDALNEKDASEVYLGGEKVFERRNGEWYCV